eukprot:tig00021238_g19555.t1
MKENTPVNFATHAILPLLAAAATGALLANWRSKPAPKKKPGQPVVVVDAFTQCAYGGNPAAVVVLPAARDDAWMALVAREMNLSETAFVQKRPDGFSLRWLTPTVEVNLCGHATLAASHVLWEEGHLARGEAARFHTRSGVLTARREGDLIVLDFPAAPPRPMEARLKEKVLDVLAQGLGVPRRAIADVWHGGEDVLVLIEDERLVRSGLKPSSAVLNDIVCRGIIVTAPSSGPREDFVSRFFGPRCGIEEDPVTGSAHCVLAPFWGERLGKHSMRAHQASARGGELEVELGEGGRVLIKGRAVTTLRGHLLA